MKAAILAGGFGTRIQPLTSELPKPMLPVMNRPLLSRVLDGLDPLAPTDAAFFLFYIPERVSEWLAANPRPGTRFSVHVPDADLGTAGALSLARGLLDGTFVVVSGDVLSDIDLAALIESHRRFGAAATIALTSVANPLQYGVVAVGDDGRIRRFLEKPGWRDVVSDTVNTGIYVLEPEALALIPDGVSFDFSHDLFPLMLKKGLPVFGKVSEGYWRDVGNPEAYRQVHADLFAHRSRIVPPGQRVAVGEGEAYLEEGAEICPQARVAGSVVLGRGVHLPRGFYSRSVFGEGVEVAEGCFIEGSVLWPGVRVGPGARVRNAILCSGVRLGEEVYVPDGAVVASHSILEDRVTLERDVTVGPGKVVEAGSMITANLVNGERFSSSLFTGNRVSGHTSSGMSAAFCARLGEAFGSVMPQGERMLASRDYHKASRMLQRAFLGGVLGTGVNVADLSLAPVPVALHRLAALGEAGGVHVRQKPEDEEATEILFYDSQGFPLTPEKGKAIERAFMREDFRRPRHDQAGNLSDLPLAADLYREAFLKMIDRTAVRQRGFSLVLDLAHGLTADLFPGILTELGCETVVLNAHRDEARLAMPPAEIRRALTRVGKIVRSLKADMGFYLFPGGMRVLLVDGRGVPRPDHECILFLLTLLSAAGDHPRVHLPGHAPRLAISRIPGLDAVFGPPYLLTPKESMAYDAIISRRGRYAFPRFLPQCDGMFAVASILDMLARSGRAVEAAWASLPPCSYMALPIDCPPERVGKVMRAFRVEAGKEGELSFEDGIRAAFAWGWISLTPDEHKPRLLLHLEAWESRRVREEAARWTRWVAGLTGSGGERVAVPPQLEAAG
jgi:mannose-1-phosphate guanylyltransferase/phosphomannomutase